jgi:hypothetical protein
MGTSSSREKTPGIHQGIWLQMNDLYYIEIMKRVVFTLLFSAFFLLPVFSRDFKEPPVVYDPLACQEGEQVFLNYVYGDARGEFQCFHGSDYDNFDARALITFNLVSLESTFALNGFWDVYLLIGPVAPGEAPPTIAAFWMNAVQFQYGFTASFNLSGWHILLESSRTSQHPFAGRTAMAEIATDVLRTGFTAPPLTFGDLAFAFALRTGYIDLFDFWQSTMPKPRTFWIFSPSLSANYRLNGLLSLYGDLGPDFLILRKGGFDANLTLEAGVEIGYGKPRLRLFLEYYHTGDTEEIQGTASPVDLFGAGFQFSTADGRG